MAIQSSQLGTLTIRVLATWAIVHGILTFIGGPERWVGPAYDFVKIMPWSPYTWGLILVLGGLLALFASIKGVDFVYSRTVFGKTITINYDIVKNLGLWIIAIWCMAFVVGFIGAILVHPEISLAIADRDIPFIIFCLMMTKAREPRYIK